MVIIVALIVIVLIVVVTVVIWAKKMKFRKTPILIADIAKNSDFLSKLDPSLQFEEQNNNEHNES